MKILVSLAIIVIFCHVMHESNGQKKNVVTTKRPESNNNNPGNSQDQQDFQVEEEFCYADVQVPFYQRDSDGAVCCRGKELPVITITPDTRGDCAISTKTDENGILDSENLWCSYTCSLKKRGAIDRSGNVVPEKFFDHLTTGLTTGSKTKLKTIMTDYLKCYKPIKNTAKPCYTPLSFQKCYQDALVFLCSVGVSKNNNFTGFAKISAAYENVKPFCYYNNRKIMPGCCHGKPLPWTITEILEAPSNVTKISNCLQELGPDCDATCFLKSVGVVNDDMDLDVDKFGKLILKHFPTVKVSSWMDFTGPVFLFYDEILVDMGDEVSDATQRICRFHDRIMELHESKIEQYCAMSPQEVKELVKSNQ